VSNIWCRPQRNYSAESLFAFSRCYPSKSYMDCNLDRHYTDPHRSYWLMRLT